MYVYIDGKRFRPDPTQSIGKGGEADIFALPGQQALKIFKDSGHPDLIGQPLEQRAAALRIKIHQKKLPKLLDLSSSLPDKVVKPLALATNQDGSKILGYTMQHLKDMEVLLRYTDRSFRENGISNQIMVAIFLDLYQTVSKLHPQMIIGDFNDLNVLIKDKSAWIIDIDSAQFAEFFCSVFTQRFADPLLCDSKENSLKLIKPHNINSDWFAYAVMLMQCLLFVNPYGGTYKPKDKTKRIPHDARPLHRISVFHPEVKYPKPAIHYSVLPDNLLHFFHQTFVYDQRGPFPVDLLNNLTWTICPQCHTEHARLHCPQCSAWQPGIIKEIIRVRGQVKSTRIFHTPGIILCATIESGKLKWLYHQSKEFKREDGTIVLVGDLDPKFRYRLSGANTLLARSNNLITLSTDDKQRERIDVDTFGSLPIFDANQSRRYWLQNGQIMTDDTLAPKIIGEVLKNQTLFWVGPKFGFGFYRAGSLNIAFVFDANRKGINDSIKLQNMHGQLLDSTCVFSPNHCWFFASFQEGGKIINRCYLIEADGTVRSMAETEANDGSWLGTLRGKAATKNYLFSATDEGIIRVEDDKGQLSSTREFPDTEPFIDSSCNLFIGDQGLYAVDRKEIRLLQIT